MRPYYAILPLVMIASSLLLAVPLSPVDAEVEFDDGVLRYYAIGEDTVKVASYVADCGVSDVVVPDHVEYDGVTYTVISLSYQALISPDIISVTIPHTVKTLYAECFEGENIQHIEVDPFNPNFVSLDGIVYDHNFREVIRCPEGYQSTTVELPELVAAIGGGAFDHCMIETVKLNDGLIMIDTAAFYHCSRLSMVTVDGETCGFPRTLSIINSSAFSQCISLTEIEFPLSLTLIGDSAFNSTGLTEVSIPSSVNHIGIGAFGSCENLKSIEANTLRYTSIDGVLFKIDNMNRLECYPAGKEDAEYRIPDDVTSINPGAFSGCINLKKVHMGNMSIVPEGSFSFCTSLEEIDLSKVTAVGNIAFTHCTSLKYVTFGNSLITIENNAFEWTTIEELVLPSSLLEIGGGAFTECVNLMKVTFPDDSECYVGAYAFWGDFRLNEMYVGSSKVLLDVNSLSIGSRYSESAILTITVPKGYQVPSSVCDEYTLLTITHIGEKPYPYENFIGVFICLLVLFAIFRFFRKV